MSFPSSIESWSSVVDNVDNVMAVHINEARTCLTAVQTKIGIDNSGVVTTIDYFLKNASGAYRTHTHDGTSDDGAKIPMSSLSEVSISGLANQQYLRYNSSSGKWENYTFTYALSNLSDCTISSPASREGIFYNSGTAKWNNGYPNAVYSS
jgi:hypothetical protein